MARSARSHVLVPHEIVIAHVMSRVVRRCYLMGTDRVTGKNYDHRKGWIEDLMRHYAQYFAIDVLCFAILDNHFHQVLRTRPDMVRSWDDTEVARRWLMICPRRRGPDGLPLEPNEAELNSIRTDPDKLRDIRLRLSDISWWMRLICQKIARRANAEDETSGRFWECRFRAVRILDDATLLACGAYVDLNPIRAALAELLELSQHTSIQRRIEALQDTGPPDGASQAARRSQPADSFLAPLTIDELRDGLGTCPSASGHRCSDKGFLNLSLESYIELLDWTARLIAPGKRGTTPTDAPEVLARLGIEPTAWCELVSDFGRLFIQVAGRPPVIDSARSHGRNSRFRVKPRARELLAEC